MIALNWNTLVGKYICLSMKDGTVERYGYIMGSLNEEHIYIVQWYTLEDDEELVEGNIELMQRVDFFAGRGLFYQTLTALREAILGE